MTATLRYRDVPNDAIKLMLFPYSLEDRARIWACPHNGFSELTQIDTFYNGLTEQDHDSLNAASGGNLLNKTTREALQIIENKSKVRYSRSKSNVSRVNTNSKDVVSKTNDRIDKLVEQISNFVEIVNKQVIAPAKAVKKTCVTRGGAHTYYESVGTDSNPSSVCAATGSYNQVSPPNRASHQIPPPGFALVQNNPNRGNNFQNNQGYRAQMNNVPNFQNQGRSFLRTGRALIDVYGEEIALRVNDESITFNLNQTMRYSLTYDDTSVNRVDVIDIACEDFVQDVLDFQYNPKSSNPTLVSNASVSEKVPIVKSSLPTLTSFGESDFFLEEIEDFLNDDSIPTGIENSVYVPEGDILFLEKLLNEDPFQLPPMDLKVAEESKEKSSVEEPPELELKELPSHLEEALINVLKSHKWAIAWKISDIKGIDPRFCTHKILMDDDYKPAVQSQRRVNPKIHDVIKKEVIKLLDASMIYTISDSPWVSPIHCVLKNGGIIVVANENNELIPTRLVTGWRVCIDYRKLNDATRKDHFPLPFMDQMLEKLAGNEFYSFLDGFLGYFQIPIDLQDQKKLLSHALMEPSRTDACPLACVMLQVDRAKVDVIAKLPHPTTVKVLGQHKHLQPIHYASKTMTEAQIHYTTIEKEMLVVVYAFEKFRPYLVLSKSIVYTDHSALKYLLNKQDAKPRQEAFKILKACYEGPSGGHHGANLTVKKAYENSVSYKERTKKQHDSKIKNRIFNVGDQVFLFNFRLKIFPGKLKTRWSGPFTITHVFPYGTIELSQPNGLNFKVNVYRVKHYFGGDIPSNVAPDLHTFPMDK
nr:reverse transcriptase domain-containing protein [Tanacetum cinerariifolium]